MFKWLLDNSLTNRLLVIIASVVLMAYGAFTLSRTPVDVFPDLNKPTVTIMTEAGGMAAEEVEQLITFPLETTMNGLPGVESVRSTSSAGLSFLYVTFDWSTDIFRARQLVSERLSSMEEGIAEGVMGAVGAGGQASPTLRYAVPSQTNLDSNTVDLDRERANFADNTVRYEATLRFINSQVRTLNTAITGQ